MTPNSNSACAERSALETRLARVESRLVQLMHYLGAKPDVRYGPPAPTQKTLDVLTRKRETN